MSGESLSEKFITPNGHCRCCGWFAESKGHDNNCPVPEVAALEAKAKHFDAIIELIKIDNYDETIMHTIFEYCKENDINIQCH